MNDYNNNMKNNYKVLDNIVEIELSQGKIAIIDKADMDLVSQYRWCAQKERTGNYYAATNIRNSDSKWTTLQMHRLLMQTPQGMHTDHIDHNGLNNCRSNLRIVTNQQNLMNQRSNCGSSKFKGVCWHKRVNRWRAQITINKKVKHLGYFTSEQLAADAYNHAATQYYGSFANLNNTGDQYDYR